MTGKAQGTQTRVSRTSTCCFGPVNEHDEGPAATNAANVEPAGGAKRDLTVETRTPEVRSGDQTPANESDTARAVHFQEKQLSADDGNESDDSAMLESPLSGKEPSETGTPMT